MPRGFEMRVRAFDPYVAPERFRELGVERAETLDDLVAEADFVSLHSTLTPETRGLIGGSEIARMKDGVRIVNVARGELVDEDALAGGSRERQGRGAPRSTSSRRSRIPARSSSCRTSWSRRTWPPRRRRPRTAPGVIVAEQVAAALEGGMVTNALNVPAVAAEDLDALGPFLPLAADLGALAIELAGGTAERLDFRYLGELADRDTRLLTVAALNGAFRGRVEEPVNYVNAPLVAEERGIEVREEQRRASRHFKNLITVTAVAGDEEFTVGGTITGRDDEPRLVRALGYDVEIAIEPLMLFVVNDDRPGGSAAWERSWARPTSTSPTWPSRGTGRARAR